MEICRGIMGYRGHTLTWILLLMTMLAPDSGTNAQCSSNIPCQNGGRCLNSADGPKCECPDGTSGDLCEVIGVDDCLTPTVHQCRNNAKCVDGPGNYSCDCLSGWEGTFCEKEKDECQSLPCRNGGKCTDEFDGYKCECSATFTGPDCTVDVDECSEPGPLCQNDAVCRNDFGGFTCECQPGFTGSLCETEVDECDGSPCYFGGKCVDLINNFRCECLDGFAGPQCQGVVQECQLSDVCGDNGICIGKPLGGYECFCKPGYFGDHCETQVDLCSASPCRNRATCINYGTAYTCNCVTGYTGQNCENDVNECASEPCLHSGTCFKTISGGIPGDTLFNPFVTGYDSNCPENLIYFGYTGQNCENDVNECASEPCLHNGTCSEPSPGGYLCECAPGYTGQTCDVDIDDCSDSLCPSYQQCRDLVNGFSCHCPPGKTGDLCTTDTFDCRVSPCQNGGGCVEGSEAYTCECPSPFTGESCSTSSDPCIPNPCVHGGLCNNRINGTGFWCECLDGYVGNRCEGDVYDCLSAPCQNNGTCRDLPFNEGEAGQEERVKFECDCRQGFTGRLCETEMDACWDNRCQNGANCTVIGIEDYSCKCSQEWTGQHCDTNVNECLTIPAVCLNNGQCIDLTPGFRCVCPEPWTGPLCQDRIVYCGNDTCKNGGTCVEGNVGGGDLYTCQCPEAYTGVDCSIQRSPCLPTPCLHNSTCRVTDDINQGNTSTNGVDGGDGGKTFVCDCTPGYTGKTCGGNIDECTKLKPCQNNGTCYDGIDSYRCECLTPWTGPVCDVPVNACVPDPCVNGGVCQEGNVTQEAGGSRDGGGDGGDVGTYECRCLPGYTGLHCEDEIKRCEARPCLNNATCVQGEESGDFTCDCLTGFTGVFCETNVDDCDPNPCQGTATCQDLIDDFLCKCPPGFTGRTCNEPVRPCMPSPCLLGGICDEEGQGSFSCTCPSGVEGDRCQTVLTASFDGVSSLDLPSLNAMLESQIAGGNNHPLIIRKKRRSGSDIMMTHQLAARRIVGAEFTVQLEGEDVLEQQWWYQQHHADNVLSRRKRDAHDGGDDNSNMMMMISFTFTTTVMDGILFLATGTSKDGHPQHVVMELQPPNQLFISLSNGHQTLTQSLVLGSSDLNVHSHAVELTLGASSPSTIKVTSSSCSHPGGSEIESGSACPSATLTFQNEAEWIFDGSFHLGGVGEFTPYTRSIVTTTSGFTGCLGNVGVDGNAVNLGEASQFRGSEHQTSAPNPGCPTHTPCAPDMCLNSGACIDLWLTKTCDCPVGFGGEKCEIQTTAHFEVDSLLYVGSFDTLSEISFWMTGTTPDGLLLYTLAGDSLSLSLENSVIRMSIILQATGRDLVVTVGDSLPIGNWLKVHLTIVDSSYSLQVSTEENEMVDSADGTADSVIRVYGPLFIGSLHPHPALDKWRKGETSIPTASGFKGCIRDIVINGQPVNILDTTPSSLGNDPPRPRSGCGREESCRSLPCSNGGVCQAGWGGAVCQCEDSFQGESCQNAIAYTFDGTHSFSFLQIDRTLIGFGEHGGIEFRTRQNISTLMMIQVFQGSGQSETMEFRIFSGRLQTFSSFTQETAESEFLVSDGEWHSLAWRRDKDLWSLTLDDAATFDLRASFDPYHSNLNHTVHVYVGARPLSHDTSSHIVGFFQGCIRNVTFNSHLINLASRDQDSSQPGVVSTPTSIISGCHNISICNINPCPSNSYCKEEWNDFSCHCLPGWEGPACDRSTDDCKFNVCQNSAVCVDLHLSYTCECPEQYTGRLCETSYEPCQEQVCSVENTLSCVSYNYSSFVCECKPGYNGDTCDSVIDNCASRPCLNEAVCVNSVNNYTCECREGFLGRNCHIKDYCLSTPCFNGGECSLVATQNDIQITNNPESSIPSSDPNDLPYVCQCLAPYFGSRCQEYDYCQQHRCKNDAPCILEPNRYTCNCSQGFYGTYCEFKDHCFTKPCLNGGECRNSADSHTCVCPFYFTGDNCQTPVNQCLNNVCLNGATCVFNASLVPSSSSSLDTDIRTYECVCLEGFTGLNCEVDINECESNPCENNSTCIESSSLTRNSFFPGYRCDCEAGFTGQQCENNVDDCVENPCQNGGQCLDRINGYECVCVTGFVNPDCSVDKRGCGSSPCLNGAQCEDEGDGAFTCVCADGYEGALCGDNKDDCVQHGCVNGGTCVDGISNYTCRCLDGYGGPKCTEIVDACYTQPCHHGGVCSYRGVCTCGDVVIACGWHDEDCQRDRCQERNDCTVLSPSYSCDCVGTGYEGTQCTVDVDECNPGAPSPPCQNGGTCVNSIGSYTCECDNTGYQGDVCQDDVDECDSSPENPCFNGGTCINEIGTFRCQCLEAWTGDLCGQRKDFCEGGPCLNQGVCTSGLDEFTCDCTQTGFEGDTCGVNIDDCVNNRCQHGSVCQDGVRQYTCDCDGTGFTGQFCQEPSSSCASLSCLHNGTCVLVGVGSVSSEVGGVTCLCHDTGYHGHRCQYDDDECQDGSHKCHAESSQCVNTAGSYTCDCQDGYSGQFCETAMFREDDSSSADVSDGVIAVCVLLVLFLVVMLSLYLLWQWKRKRKTQGRYKPSQVEGVMATGEIPMDKLAHRDERLI